MAYVHPRIQQRLARLQRMETQVRADSGDLARTVQRQAGKELDLAEEASAAGNHLAAKLVLQSASRKLVKVADLRGQPRPNLPVGKTFGRATLHVDGGRAEVEI